MLTGQVDGRLADGDRQDAGRRAEAPQQQVERVAVQQRQAAAVDPARRPPPEQKASAMATDKVSIWLNSGISSGLGSRLHSG